MVSTTHAGDSATLCGYDELPITGYLDRMSARPGETIEARIGVRDGGPCRARLLRTRSADPNPQGPGIHFDDLSPLWSQTFDGQRQPIALGSYMEAAGPDLDQAGCWTWTALVHPTMAQQAPRVVLHHDGGDAALTILLSGTRLEARVGGETMAITGLFAPRRWYRLWLSIDGASGKAVLGMAGPAHLYDPAMAVTASALLPQGSIPRGGALRIAAAVPGDVAANFTGKIEDPAIVAGFHESWPDPLSPLSALEGLVAAWDFAQDIALQTVSPTGPQATVGRLVNLPLRGVVGARWTGRENDWRHAPRDYGAIKFHEDDLGDCGWDTSLHLTIPAGLASGAYVLHVACNAGEDWLPFYVLPERGKATARTVFVAATYTYLAYGNNARFNTDQAFFDRVRAWGAYPANPDQYPIYGRSTYNLHPDGSGVVYSSRLRPLLTVRPGYMTMMDPKGSGIRHYAADTHILAWLAAQDIACDIVTDDDLEREGAELLAPYDVLLTGTHPEYHTAATLDALQAHVTGGSRMAYLGGNGFYWRIGHSPAMPWALELRRAENGVRRWGSEPGEYHHALDGELGGLWSRSRRDPRRLVGVAFSAQGPYEASYFRRTPASFAPALSWMFDGVEGDVLGDYGLVAGGSAGFELDRVDHRHGTPAHAVVIAVTENLPEGFFPAHEDLGGVPLALGGGDAADLVRGDMVWFETPAGGQVFSASSITFCGSLWKDGGFQGPVSRLLENIVRHMLQD